MKFLFALSMTVILVAACHSNKNSTTQSKMDPAPVQPDMKGNLLDGSWAVNYIMNAPKPVADLFPKGAPGITFNSVDGTVSGMSGCNNFNGKFTTEGKALSINENMALTRKMCPDMAGEELFLQTLKKANAYSVTEQGKTLNLIMGDIAIMRLARKPNP